MSIASDLIRGHTDAIILAHLISGDSYGYEINKHIRRNTDDRFELKEATLYTAFRRLEEAGHISSYWGDEATGARRKYYTITNLGRKVFMQMYSEWQEAKEIIDRLMDTGGVTNGE